MSGPGPAVAAGAAARRPPPARTGGPRSGGPGPAAEKPKDLKGSFRRLAVTLRPESAPDRAGHRSWRS